MLLTVTRWAPLLLVAAALFFAFVPASAQTSAPAAPTNLSAQVGSGQVTLTWDDPSDSTITSYDYRVSSDGGSTWGPDWTQITNSGATTITYTVGSLTDGTQYDFEIRAVAGSLQGAAASITATAALNLSAWTNEDFPAQSYSTPNWSVASDGASVQQTVISGPSVYYRGSDSYGREFAVTVNPGSQKYYVGLVVGFNSGDTTSSSADYLLIDWLKEDLDIDLGGDDARSPGGLGKAGLAVSRVTGAPDLDELWQHKNLGGTSEENGVEELARGANLGSSAFSAQDYEFTIDFGRYGVKVYVDGTLELDIQGTFADGKVGFYEFWQDTVTFKDLSVATGSFTETQQVSFSQDVFAAHEGGSATVTVKVDADLDSDLSVPITFTDDADAPPESGEYRVTGLTTNNDFIIAADGDSEPDSATFTISTKADAESDDEKVTLGIGSLPTGILAGPDATFVIAERRTPGQPDAPTLKPVFDGLAVSWDRPGDAFDGLATYNLRYQDSATEDTTQWTDAEYGGTAREATVTGLSAGVEYNVQVQASNGTGYDGGWSGSATAFVCHEDMGALTLGTYTREGRLASDCLSVNSDLAKYGIDVYARYYTFQIDQAQRVRVELSGVLDNIPGGGATAVYLVSGSGPEGTVVAGSSGGIPAIVEVELDPGTYTVEATEPFGAQSGTFTLNAIVLNRGPVFDETAPTRSVAENSAGGTNVVNPADPGQNDDPVSATDPGGDTPLTYSFATDAEGVLQDAEARFTIDSATGLISVAAGAVLDFETESSHIVQVGVSDGMKGNDTPDPDNIIDTTIDVTINLTDANDPGVVSLSWPHAYLGYALEATLQDQDQVTASTESWQWQSADPSSDLSDASCQLRVQLDPLVMSMARDSVSTNGQRKCQSERLEIC